MLSTLLFTLLFIKIYASCGNLLHSDPVLNGLDSAKIFEPNVEGLGGEMCVDIQHTWYDT